MLETLSNVLPVIRPKFCALSLLWPNLLHLAIASSSSGASVTTALAPGSPRAFGLVGSVASKPRVSFCCVPGQFLEGEECRRFENETATLPSVYTAELEPENVTVDEKSFVVLSWNPCENDSERYPLQPEDYPDERWYLLRNGTVYKPLSVDEGRLEYWEYCLAAVRGVPDYVLLFCYDSKTEPEKADDAVRSFGMIVSVPFLAATYAVYSILPDLRNLHGLTLRGYVGSLAIAYIVLAVVQTTPQSRISDGLCILLAFIIHFSFLASFFWLNVMCFDIWWTFGGFRSPQGSVKQRERKKFTVYSIYAWGSASILTGVCLIMDFVPGIPEHFIRPQFGDRSCWFTTDAAKAIYFYGPMGVTVLCNIGLFVSTALKIVRHKQDTARHLKGTDSRRHDDNKQWFNLYLKLFIVMGINWSMEIVSWLCQDAPTYVWYITDLTNTLQGLIIFLIFVWKEKIKRLLLKRLGCQSRGVLSRNSTRSVYHSSASRTCTTSAAPLQERINPYATDASYRTKALSEESDCA